MNADDRYYAQRRALALASRDDQPWTTDLLLASAMLLPNEVGLFFGTSSFTWEFQAIFTGATGSAYANYYDGGGNRISAHLPYGGTMYYDTGNLGAGGRLVGPMPAGYVGTPTHFALVVDTAANQTRVLVNGVLHFTQAGYSLRYPESNPVFLYNQQGVIGNVRYWNYARTEAQTAADLGTAFATPRPGLVGNWWCDERGPSGTDVVDYSGNNYTGYIY